MLTGRCSASIKIASCGRATDRFLIVFARQRSDSVQRQTWRRPKRLTGWDDKSPGRDTRWPRRATERQAGRRKKEKQINVASPPPLLVQTLHHLSCCLLLTSAWTAPAAAAAYGCQVRRREQVTSVWEVIWRAKWQTHGFFFFRPCMEPSKQQQQQQPSPSLLDLIIYSCCFRYRQMLTN